MRQDNVANDDELKLPPLPKWIRLFRQYTSLLLIVSLLWPDISRAMEEEYFRNSVQTPPIKRNFRSIDSTSSDPNSSQEDIPTPPNEKSRLLPKTSSIQHDEDDSYILLLDNRSDRTSCCRPFWPQKPNLYFNGKLPPFVVLIDIKRDNLTSGVFQDDFLDEEILGNSNAKPLKREERKESEIIIEEMPLRKNAIIPLKGPYLPNSQLQKSKEWIEELSEKVKARIKRIADQDVHGKITKTQWVGILLGLGMAIWLPYGMVGVYESALDWVGLNYNIFYKQPWMNVYNGLQYAIEPYVIPVVVIQSLGQIPMWKRALTYLKEESLHKGRLIATAFTSFSLSLFEPGYLILLDLELIKIAKSIHTPYQQYVTDMLVWTWPLLIVNCGSNFELTWEMWDEFKEWRQKSDSRLASFTRRICCMPTLLPTGFQRTLNEFTTKLEKLAVFLYHAAGVDFVETMYKAIQGGKAEISETFPDLDKDYHETAQSFFTYHYLLSAADQIEEGEKQARSLYESMTDFISNVCLLTGSPARLLVLQLIISSLTDLIPGGKYVRGFLKVVNWGLASVAWIFQTVFESYGMKRFFNSFLVEKEPHEHKVYGKARTGGKIFSGIQSFVFTIPLFITCLQVCSTWALNPLWTLGAIGFLFAEFATQASSQWGSSVQEEISFLSRIHNHFTRPKLKKEPVTDFKRDWLINFVLKQKKRLPYVPPVVMKELDRLLKQEDEEDESQEVVSQNYYDEEESSSFK